MTNKTEDNVVVGYLLEPEEVLRRAVSIAEVFGSCSGERQKAWVIDQMVRLLYRGDYEHGFLHSQCYTVAGQNARRWDPGIRPRPSSEKGDFCHLDISPKDRCDCKVCSERGLSESGLEKKS